MQAIEYLENIQEIMADQTKSADEKFDNILKLFRKDLSTLMYFPPRRLKDHPSTVQALRDDLKRGFSRRVNYNGD
jgi:hypothetical protein